MTSAWKMGCIRCRGCRKQSKGSGSLGGQITLIWIQISSASDLSTFQGSNLSQMNKTLYRSSDNTAEIAPRPVLQQFLLSSVLLTPASAAFEKLNRSSPRFDLLETGGGLSSVGQHKWPSWFRKARYGASIPRASETTAKGRSTSLGVNHQAAASRRGLDLRRASRPSSRWHARSADHAEPSS